MAGLLPNGSAESLTWLFSMVLFPKDIAFKLVAIFAMTQVLQSFDGCWEQDISYTAHELVQ